MLQDIKELYGNKLTALDGGIGLVKDFYFNDKTWMIRYLVAETEPWLPTRLVLLSPSKIERISCEESKVLVNLTVTDIQRTAENSLARAGAEDHATGNVRGRLGARSAAAKHAN